MISIIVRTLVSYLGIISEWDDEDDVFRKTEPGPFHSAISEPRRRSNRSRAIPTFSALVEGAIAIFARCGMTAASDVHNFRSIATLIVFSLTSASLKSLVVHALSDCTACNRHCSRIPFPYTHYRTFICAPWHFLFPWRSQDP